MDKSELIKKINERMEESLDDEQMKLANHVKDCHFCTNVMFYAGMIAEEHFKNMNVELIGDSNGKK